MIFQTRHSPESPAGVIFPSIVVQKQWKSDEKWWKMMTNDERWWTMMKNDENGWKTMKSNQKLWKMIKNDENQRKSDD